MAPVGTSNPPPDLRSEDGKPREVRPAVDPRGLNSDRRRHSRHDGTGRATFASVARGRNIVIELGPCQETQPMPRSGLCGSRFHTRTTHALAPSRSQSEDCHISGTKGTLCRGDPWSTYDHSSFRQHPRASPLGRATPRIEIGASETTDGSPALSRRLPQPDLACRASISGAGRARRPTHFSCGWRPAFAVRQRCGASRSSWVSPRRATAPRQ